MSFQEKSFLLRISDTTSRVPQPIISSSSQYDRFILMTAKSAEVLFYCSLNSY